MSKDIIQFLEKYKKSDLTDFRVGDIVKVHQEIEEGGKKRIQPFEGLVIAKKHGSEIGATFTVRTKIAGIGTEKIFSLHSPTIKKIEVLKRATKISKSKIYWVRHKTDREIQRKLKFTQINNKKNSKKKK
jgi:large subunit ribosomal protein L19